MGASEPWPVHAGLDEAGYGPLLGPLTIGFSAFRTTGEDAEGWAPDWRRLRSAVCADPNGDGERLVVADSKKVFTRTPRGERRLESTAIAFLRAAGHPVLTALDVVRRAPETMAPTPELLGAHPWYAALPARVPHRAVPTELERLQIRLETCLKRSRTEICDAGVVVVPAGALNASFAATDNKGATLWSVNSRVIGHLFETFGHEGLELTVDRLGGRARYGHMLGELIPFSSVRVLSESGEDSRYEVRAQGRRMRVRFVQKGDSISLPVALGSCLAKYARELVMTGFNQHFSALCPPTGATPRPTAGYVTDARRWLEDMQSLHPAALQNRDVLVRTR